MLGDISVETTRLTTDLNRFTDVGPVPVVASEAPELMATHQVSHLRDHGRALQSGVYARSTEMLPSVRTELARLGMEDPTGLFTVFCLVPVGIIHHKDVRDPPRSWSELAAPRWAGTVTTFDMNTIYALLRIGMRDILGRGADAFIESMHFRGTPMNVNHMVDAGEVEVAVMPLPFGQASRQGNVRFQWPEEGALVVPNVLLLKALPDPRAVETGRYLLSEGVQRMMGPLGLIPVHPGVAMPRLVEKHNLQIRWSGWPTFVERLNLTKLVPPIQG